MHVWHVYFVHFGDFRTGCGGKLAPGILDPAALELIPTGTLTLAGAVSLYIFKSWKGSPKILYRTSLMMGFFRETNFQKNRQNLHRRGRDILTFIA